MNPFPQITLPLMSAPVGAPLEWFAHYGAVPMWLLLAVGAASVGVPLSRLYGNWRLQHQGLRHAWAESAVRRSLRSRSSAAWFASRRPLSGL